MKACAPGKLILSGEHSVVYGAPAIALALDRKATAAFYPDDTDLLTISSDALGQHTFQLADFEQISQQADERFALFEQDRLSITDVLSSPFDLIIYALQLVKFSTPGHLRIHSEIPVGAGMGSSAATIAALLRLAESVPLPDQAFFRLVRLCERLQHGKGSAIDAAAVTFGGMVRVQADQIEPLELELGDGWYVWNSGTPASTTGECVAQVRKQHQYSDIWLQFADITSELVLAINAGRISQIKALVEHNHQLLVDIGVVPDYVRNKIERIKHLGGAGKVCGAGAISGQYGGQVLVYLPDDNPEQVSADLQIELQCLRQAKEGARRVCD